MLPFLPYPFFFSLPLSISFPTILFRTIFFFILIYPSLFFSFLLVVLIMLLFPLVFYLFLSFFILILSILTIVSAFFLPTLFCFNNLCYLATKQAIDNDSFTFSLKDYNLLLHTSADFNFIIFIDYLYYYCHYYIHIHQKQLPFQVKLHF